MRKVFLILSGFGLAVLSCSPTTTRHAQQDNPSHHLIEIRQPGIGMIGIDKVPNNAVIQTTSTDSDSGTSFFSYAVSFQDSVLILDKDKQLDLGKYYQYEMHKDWIALVNGDSIRPVFYQPGVKRSLQTNEAIIVFEVAPGCEPDTLLFMDSYGAWGQHEVYLGNNLK